MMAARLAAIGRLLNRSSGGTPGSFLAGGSVILGLAGNLSRGGLFLGAWMKVAAGDPLASAKARRRNSSIAATTCLQSYCIGHEQSDAHSLSANSNPTS